MPKPSSKPSTPTKPSPSGQPGKPTRLLLRLPSASSKDGAVWEINLEDITADPKERPLDAFPRHVTLGDSNLTNQPFLLDLNELAGTMERWVQNSRRAGTAGESTATTSAAQKSDLAGLQAGPHDIVYPVVVGQKPDERLELRLIPMEVTRDGDKVASLTPHHTKQITYPPTRAAMRALFRSGAILMYLPQTTFPIGVTCYLLNLLALDGVDIDQLV